MPKDENFMLCSGEDYRDTLTDDYRKKWGDIIIQNKYDGERAIFIGKRLVNRRGNDITPKYSHIKVNEDCVIDGEVVIFTDEQKLKTDFNMVRTKIHYGKAVFVVFDVIKFGGISLMDKPLKERYEYLNKITGDSIIKITELKSPSWSEVLELGLEGWIMKNPNGKYNFERSKDWIKVKRKIETFLKFNQYKIHNKGLTLINDDGYRCACNGEQHKEVKNIIDEKGFVEVGIEGMEMTKTGKIRQIVFKGLKR